MLESEGGDAALGGSVVGSAAASFPVQANLSNGSDRDLKQQRSASRSAQRSAVVKRARGGQGLRQPGAGDAAKTSPKQRISQR